MEMHCQKLYYLVPRYPFRLQEIYFWLAMSLRNFQSMPVGNQMFNMCGMEPLHDDRNQQTTSCNRTNFSRDIRIFRLVKTYFSPIERNFSQKASASNRLKVFLYQKQPNPE